MAKTAFTKGQQVTIIGSWDGKGTFYYVSATVHSCGQKRLILTRDDNGQEMGREFSPVVSDLSNYDSDSYGKYVIPRISNEKAEAACITLAVQFLERQKARYELLIAKESNNARYVAAIRKDIDALHEPRAYHLNDSAAA